MIALTTHAMKETKDEVVVVSFQCYGIPFRKGN